MTRGPLPTQAEFHQAIASRADAWYSACLRITRSPELAEDAVQEALLSAWAKRDQFQGDARLETWIHRIAINAALQLVRKQKPGMFTPLDEEPPGDNERPDDLQHQDETVNLLARALPCLTEAERVCFVLKHLEQWRLQEIADELGTNTSSVKQALFRGVRKLRGKLADLRSTSL